jgi:hypothetical protein
MNSDHVIRGVVAMISHSGARAYGAAVALALWLQIAIVPAARYQSAVYFTDLTYTAVLGQGGYSLYNARITWATGTLA